MSTSHYSRNCSCPNMISSCFISIGSIIIHLNNSPIGGGSFPHEICPFFCSIMNSKFYDSFRNSRIRRKNPTCNSIKRSIQNRKFGIWVTFHQPCSPAIRAITCFTYSSVTIIGVNRTPLIITIWSCILSSPNMITSSNISIRSIVISLENTPTRHRAFHHNILNHPGMIRNCKSHVHLSSWNWYDIIGMPMISK